MDNFNKPQILYCKYCGKECKNLNSLKQHECRCKQNPNRIKITINSSYYSHHHKGTINGKICINNGKNHKYILPEELNKYLLMGWNKGVTEEFKSKKCNSSGIASTPELEMERKRKISETMKRNPLAGGYRIGSGRGHQGWYNNIYCDSSWELAFVCYYIEHNMNIQRCKEQREYIWNNEKHIYIPDFITDDGIIEIKGYSSKQWKAKERQNLDIKVLYLNDMKKYIDYVVNKYGDKYWEILYNK